MMAAHLKQASLHSEDMLSAIGIGMVVRGTLIELLGLGREAPDEELVSTLKQAFLPGNERVGRGPGLIRACLIPLLNLQPSPSDETIISAVKRTLLDLVTSRAARNTEKRDDLTETDLKVISLMGIDPGEYAKAQFASGEQASMIDRQSSMIPEDHLTSDDLHVVRVMRLDPEAYAATKRRA